jgi:hypothetical protein
MEKWRCAWIGRHAWRLQVKARVDIFPYTDRQMFSVSKRRLITLLLLLFGAFSGGASAVGAAAQLSDASVTAHQATWSEAAFAEYRLPPPTIPSAPSPLTDAEPRILREDVPHSQFQRPPPNAPSLS